MTVLSGKAVVVTGAGRGLGVAYARLAAREDASVIEVFSARLSRSYVM